MSRPRVVLLPGLALVVGVGLALALGTVLQRRADAPDPPPLRVVPGAGFVRDGFEVESGWTLRREGSRSVGELRVTNVAASGSRGAAPLVSLELRAEGRRLGRATCRQPGEVLRVQRGESVTLRCTSSADVTAADEVVVR